MDNLGDLLSSISPDDLERIRSVASSLSGSAGVQGEQTAKPPSPALTVSDDMSEMLVKVASQLNKDSDKTAFIRALRPLLSDERQKKADEAMHFLKLMDTLPLLRGML